MRIFQNAHDCETVSIEHGPFAKGRRGGILAALQSGSFEFHTSSSCSMQDIERVHDSYLIDRVKQLPDMYPLAMEAAGAAIAAGNSAMDGKPSMALTCPPGHHAGRKNFWGYCYFNNAAVAVKRLFAENRIRKAFILDIDTHTGDGTLDIFRGDPGVTILNPHADDRTGFLDAVVQRCRKIEQCDIIVVCAGFDAYEKDVGRKLKTFDFYQLASEIKLLCRKLGHQRRFAVLEGGYYLPDLGKNVRAFCDGFA